MEVLRLILLVISSLSLVYLWLKTRHRIWEFGFINEELIRQLVRLDMPKGDSRLNSWGSRSSGGYVVVPVGRERISRFPKQMYEGESEVIVLHPLLKIDNKDSSLFVIDLSGEVDSRSWDKLYESRPELENYALLKLVRQRLGQKPSSLAKYLAIELLAPGFDIAGEKVQRQDLQSSLAYTWGIIPKNSGIQKVALTLKVEDKTKNVIGHVGTITHEIKVVSIARLTHRQVRLLMAILGVFTTALAILEALQRLHILP